MRNVLFRRRTIWAGAMGLLVAVGAIASLPADASDSVTKLHHRQSRVAAQHDQLQNEMQDANRVQTGLLARIQALDASRSRAEAKVHTLDSGIGALDLRIATTRDRLRASAHRLAAVTDQLQSILRKLEARTKAFTARAVATYEAGPTAGFDALLSSQSFGDLVNRYTYYQSALSADTKLIGQIQSLRRATTTHRSTVLSQRSVIHNAKLRLERDRSALATKRDRKRATLSSLKSLIAAKHAAVAKIETRKAQLEQAIAENVRESSQIEALLQAASGPLGPAATGSGQLVWPAIGPITSPFGWRINPLFHTREFHPGIDIGAPYGATVSAADAGVVEYAGTMTGYGNVLVIDHGGGLATLYGHLSAYSVSVGQRVGRGAPIANVGCTGWCTGPHLHFEVRVSGRPVNPVPYLT